MEDIEYEEYDDGPSYLEPREISGSALACALNSIQMLGSDPYLSMQSFNLDVVDRFIMDLEYEVLREYHREERLPGTAPFLSAAVADVDFRSLRVVADVARPSREGFDALQKRWP
jgi:hypothetical protein